MHFALAINSAVGRTQNQFHIHVDCIRADVRDVLRANLDRVGDVWAPFPEPLAGRYYQAIRINQENLDRVNPFRVLWDGDEQARDDMRMHTLVLVGETFADNTKGFVLLDDHAEPVGWGLGIRRDVGGSFLCRGAEVTVPLTQAGGRSDHVAPRSPAIPGRRRSRR